MAKEELGSAVIGLGLDLGDFDKRLKEARKKLDTKAKAMQDAANEQGEKIGKGLGAGLTRRFTNAFKPLLATLGSFGTSAGRLLGAGLIGAAAGAVVLGGVLLTKAIAKVTRAAIGSIKAFREQEKILSRIDKVLQITGQSAGFTAEELKRMATELQGITLVDDKEILNAQAMLLTFTNITGTQFQKTIRAANDLSTAMGTRLREEVLRLAKALSSPQTSLASLRETGIIFTDQQKEMIVTMFEAGEVAKAQNAIFEILAENGIGGNAIASQNFSDKLTVLLNKLNDFPPLLGESLVKALGLSGAIDTLSSELDILLVFLGRGTQGASQFDKSLELVKDEMVALRSPMAFVIFNLQQILGLASQRFAIKIDGIALATKETIAVKKALGGALEAQKALGKTNATIAKQRQALNKKLDSQTNLTRKLEAAAETERSKASKGRLGEIQQEIKEDELLIERAKSIIESKKAEIAVERGLKPDKTRLSFLGSAKDLWRQIQQNAVDAGNAEKQAAKDARLDKLKDDLKEFKDNLKAAKVQLNDLDKSLKLEEKDLTKKIREAKVQVRFDIDNALLDEQAKKAAMVFQTAMGAAIKTVTREGLADLGEFETFFNTILKKPSALPKIPEIPKIPGSPGEGKAGEVVVKDINKINEPVVKKIDTGNTFLEIIAGALETIAGRPGSGVFGTSSF